jgi:predicted NodU family carbamoyl transferase
MNILGVSGAVSHDASAALFVDGELVAAVEEDILQTDHPSPYMTFTFDVVLRLPVFH